MNPLFNDEKFHHFLNCSNIAMIYLDHMGTIVYATPLAVSITGLTVKDNKKFIKDTVFAEHFPLQNKKINDFIKYIHNIKENDPVKRTRLLLKHQAEFEITGVHKFTYQAVIHAYTKNSEAVGIILVFYDITKRKSIEAVLKTEKEKYRIIAELMDSALWEYIWLRYQGAALKEANGKTRVIMGRTLNIDKEYKDHEKLIQKTERDALSGLYNRSTTKEKAEKCFDRTIKEASPAIHSFMIIDIDNFKQANDQWGHLYGDVLLESFSKQLEALFESTDIVGRIGGDEFVVIQKDVQRTEQIEKAAKAVCDIARKHISCAGNNNDFTVSVGISSYPKDGNNYDILYKKADTALYFAKSQGKDQYAYYEPEMEHIKNEKEKSNWSTANSMEKDVPDIENRLLNFACDIVNESTDLNQAIRRILNEIGKYYDLSRIAVYEVDTDNMKADISSEWLNKKVGSHYSITADDYFLLLKESIKLFEQKGLFYFNDVTNAGISSYLLDFYEKFGTKALIQSAVYDGSKFIGMISYEDCIAARKWSKTELDTLFTLTKLIGNYIIQAKNKQKLDNEMFFTRQHWIIRN